MAQYLSADLRIRVIRAVEAGMSRNAAARRFGVSIASAVRWMDAYLRTGRTAPKPRGGDRRSGRIEAQADLLLEAVRETPDITLAELRERLIAERGETFALSTIHDFYRRHGITFKKRMARPVCKLILSSLPFQSAPTYPASELRSPPRWSSARPGPHKVRGVSAPFFESGFRVAVQLSGHLDPPLADTVGRAAAPHSRSLTTQP
jgi:transposase